MNNIHEDDWADDTWSRHSGMFVRDTSQNSVKENSPESSEDLSTTENKSEKN